jgi:Zn-dependent peptidase ImmA (M78 family)
LNSVFQQIRLPPAAVLRKILDDELDTAVVAERRGQKVYQSLQRLSQLISGEYGNRVIFELLQNAHDAQPRGSGRIAIKLVVSSAERAELYVANGGDGFTEANLEAVRNIANSTKDIGEGIGNKGVGFRSVEALTDDPRIFSSAGPGCRQKFFDGFCFRFASRVEIEARLRELGCADVSEAVSKSMPRYLATVPLDDQPQTVRRFAEAGFATVVVLPLRSQEAVNLALDQIRDLLTSEAPVLLFLDRIASLEIDVEGVEDFAHRSHLSRRTTSLTYSGHPDIRMEIRRNSGASSLGETPAAAYQGNEAVTLSKEELEETADKFRRDLGLSAEQPLDSLRVEVEGVLLIKLTGTNYLERSLVKHLGVAACDEWSAMSVPLNQSEDTWAVLLNDCHTVERQRVTVMEEYWHILLGHKLTKIARVADGYGRTYDQSEEHDAFYLAAATLLPRSAMINAVSDRATSAEIARKFGTSSELVDYRQEAGTVARARRKKSGAFLRLSWRLMRAMFAAAFWCRERVAAQGVLVHRSAVAMTNVAVAGPALPWGLPPAATPPIGRAKKPHRSRVGGPTPRR